MADVIDQVRAGHYTNNVPYSIPKPRPNEDMTLRQVREQDEDYKARTREQRKLYHEEEARLTALFAADLADEHGLTGHPKAVKVFGMAWEDGHSEGLESVAHRYAELAELVK